MTASRGTVVVDGETPWRFEGDPAIHIGGVTHGRAGALSLVAAPATGEETSRVVHGRVGIGPFVDDAENSAAMLGCSDYETLLAFGDGERLEGRVQRPRPAPMHRRALW